MAAGQKSYDERVIDRMFELEETYRAILDARAKNRAIARAMADDGSLTDEQIANVREIYPERQRSATDEAA